MNWREFWNRENSIYVNERHRKLHDERVARDIAALITGLDWNVLDYGCGEASASALVAAKCGKLFLYDSAPSVRERLRLRFGGFARIEVLELGGLAEVADASLDLVVINSVLQYLSRQEFAQLLDAARPKLKPAGVFVVADIIPAGAKATDDILALVGFAREGGFLLAALWGLVTTFFSDYRKLRAELGLTRYGEAEMTALFAAHGFHAERAARNIGHNQRRMMFAARPA